MPRVWKISPGEGANQWPMCLDTQCIVLGWRMLRDYRKFGQDKDAIVGVLGGGYGNGYGAATSILRFAYEIKRTDIVIANRGRSTVVGIGQVRGDYMSPRSPKNPSSSLEFPHARAVEWIVHKPVELGKTFFAASTITEVRTAQLNRIRRAYARQHPELKKKLDRLFASAMIDHEGSIETPAMLNAAENEFEEQRAFDSTNLRDARKRIVMEIVRRQGQPAFRRRLLEAYGRRCAITGCAVIELLEAAHLIPYIGPKTNHVANGLLLRADLHTLLDLNLIAIDDANMSLLVSPKLNGSGYERFRGKRIRVPKLVSRQPSIPALKSRREQYENEL